MTTRHGKKVALVLGSGSVKCAAALGLQNVLQREGIGIDLVVGCSAGSIYAAMIAAGHDPASTADTARRLWTRELTSQRDHLAMLRALLGRLLGSGGTFGMRKDGLILDRLRVAFGDLAIEETRIPLFITATDLANGEQVILSSGRVVDAIRASISIPYIFKPFKHGGRLLIDGFMSDPLPINVAMEEGADVIIAIGFESDHQKRFNTLGAYSAQLTAIMANNLLKARFAFHNLTHHSEVILIVPEFEQRVRLFDTEKIDYVIEVGARAAEKQLPYLPRLLELEAAEVGG